MVAATASLGGGLFTYALDVQGDIFAKLEALALAVSPAGTAGWLGTVMRDYMEKRVDERFANEGDDAVGQWKPLKEATQNIRESEGYGGAHPINVRTGKLKRYAMSSDVKVTGTLMATLQMPGDTGDMELRNKFFVAQKGFFDSQTGIGTPARPVAGLSAKDAIFAISALGMFFDAAVGAARGDGKLTGPLAGGDVVGPL